MAQYNAMARTVAAQVLAESSRAIMMPCAPASAQAPDDACARCSGALGPLAVPQAAHGA